MFLVKTHVSLYSVYKHNVSDIYSCIIGFFSGHITVLANTKFDHNMYSNIEWYRLLRWDELVVKCVHNVIC